jgi:tetratricopeptide (TPR) repeat protein
VAIRFYKWLIFYFIWFFSPELGAQEAIRDSIPSYLAQYNEAEKLIDSSKYNEAIVLLKKALKEKPDYWEAYNKMALAKIKLGNYKEAIKDLDKADKIAPFNYETIKLKGINFYLNNNFAESKVALDSATHMAEADKLDDVELYYYRALLMFKGKSYKDALEICEVILDWKPNYIDAFILKGKIRFAMKEYNHAIKELTEAIKIMPATKIDLGSYKLRAKSKFEVGDFKGAITDWNVYIESVPNEEEALISRAAAKININDNTSAIADLDEAIKVNGKNPVSYCYRGVAKGGNKQYVEALKDLDYAIKMKFDYAAAYVNRAAIKLASKDKRGACQDLEKADTLGDEIAYKLIEKYCKDTRN